MKARRQIVIAVSALFTLGIVLSGISIYSANDPTIESARLTADLDGDTKPENIILSVSGTEDFRRYTVRTGHASFDGKYFAVSGDRPKMKLIRIDSSKKQNQLLLTIPSPADCGYVILAFYQDKFFNLLEHNSKNCEEPRVDGGGLETLTWLGFWDIPKRYTLNQQGTKLNATVQTIYPVKLSHNSSVNEAVGIAVETLNLKPADCKNTTIRKGGRLTVKSYDVSKNRYLLKGSGDSCGWLSESDLHPNTVDGLPWAG